MSNPWGALVAASFYALGATLAGAYLVWFAGRCIEAHRKGRGQ